MPSDKKKNRKKRGSVSAGHGRVGKHRKHPGGRGKAGGQHHHRIMFDKYYPGYFGKKGMRNYHKNKQQKFCPELNIDQITKIYLANKENNLNDIAQNRIRIIKNGFFKVLGKGRFSTKPLTIVAKVFSKKAAKKILKAGGIIELE